MRDIGTNYVRRSGKNDTFKHFREALKIVDKKIILSKLKRGDSDLFLKNPQQLFKSFLYRNKT